MAPLRILIADDKPMVRCGIRMLLEEHEDWIVCGEAPDGSEAIKQADALKPDIVLLDLAMPKMDGLTALPAIREKAPNAAIVIVTLYGDLDSAGVAARLGANAFVSKVFLNTDLIPTIEELGIPHDAEGQSK
jgi:DNA-binding NarL/FixJ family response regulator